jgi:hypothetical protein
MKHKGLLAAFATCAAVAFAGVPLPDAGHLGVSQAYADGGKRARGVPGWKRPVRARGAYYRGGYYSYRDRDVVSSWAWTRSLFISRSYFRTPLTGLQSPAGPFDSGFFFDSGLQPYGWNNAPYPK